MGCWIAQHKTKVSLLKRTAVTAIGYLEEFMAAAATALIMAASAISCPKAWLFRDVYD